MVYAIGECLLDIVFREENPVWSCPGGSLLNSAVSLGRSGVPVAMISETGEDKTGRLILNFLRRNKVDISGFTMFPGNSTLALAFLDAGGDASYQFYHSLPEKAPEISVPDFRENDVFMMGSFYSVKLRNRPNILRMTEAARRGKAVVFYDPNFRQPHLKELPEILPFIRENIRLSDLVRGSDEDFRLIAGAGDGEQAYAFVRDCGCERLIYTKNSAGLTLYTPRYSTTVKVPSIKVESTIGAGDSFNAGLVSVIHKFGKIEESKVFWDEAIRKAIIFASEVCGSRYNFIGWPASSQTLK